MPAFSPPLSLRLNGGLRSAPFALPLAPLETLLGVRLALSDDIELGGVHYAYAAYPIPVAGLADVLVCPNDPARPAPTYAARPDLRTTLTIDWFGANLLDLGRLEWQLRAAYGDLFDLAEYSVVTLSSADAAPLSSQSHWVQFSSAARHRGLPFADTPMLACTLDIELPAGSQALASAMVASLDDDTTVLRHHSATTPPGDGRTCLALRFDTPSLLELGRYAQALELACGDTARVLGYTASGDLQRDGHLLRIEHSFAPRAGAAPGWLAGTPLAG